MDASGYEVTQSHRCDILSDPWIGAEYFVNTLDFLCIGFRRVYVLGRMRFYYPEDAFAPEIPFVNLQTALKYEQYWDFLYKFYELVRQGKIVWYLSSKFQLGETNPFIPEDVVEKICVPPEAEILKGLEPHFTKIMVSGGSDRDVQAKIRAFQKDFASFYHGTTIYNSTWTPSALEYFYSELVEMALFDLPRAIHPRMRPL